MWVCEDVSARERKWRCEYVKMWRWADVKMRRCEDEQMWRWADVKMSRCEDEKMWRWEGVREGVKMRRCEDEKVWRWDTDPHYWKNPALRRSRENPLRFFFVEFPMGFPWDSYRLFIHRKIVDPLIVVDPREALPNLRHLDLRGVGISAEGLSELRCREIGDPKNGSTWGKWWGSNYPKYGHYIWNYGVYSSLLPRILEQRLEFKDQSMEMMYIWAVNRKIWGSVPLSGYIDIDIVIDITN